MVRIGGKKRGNEVDIGTILRMGLFAPCCLSHTTVIKGNEMKPYELEWYFLVVSLSCNVEI